MREAASPPLPQDPDSSVREAASEALALLAKGLAEAGGCGPPSSTANSPVVKVGAGSGAGRGLGWAE